MSPVSIATRPTSADTSSEIAQLDAVPMDRNSNRVGHRGTYLAWIAIKRIRVDPVYQRGLNVRRVNEIAENFDIDVFGSILVSQRADGTLWALDGQHRLSAVQTIYGHDSDVEVPCAVMRNLNLPGEARVFYKMNRNRLAPTAFDGFKARLIFGDPVAVEIDRIVRDHGLSIRFSMGKLRFCEIQAINEVEKIYRRGLLTDVLTLINEGWRGEDDAHKAVMMRGVYTFLATFYDEFYADDVTAAIRAQRRRRLVDTMANLVPDDVQRKARFYQQTINAAAGQAVARALHEAYNLRQRGAIRLPAWGEEVVADEED